MELVSLLVCEAANNTPDGRMNILGGGVDKIFANKLPISVNLTISMRIETHITEAGMHKISVMFIDADGAQAMPPLNLQIEIPKGTRFMNSIVNIGNIIFSKFGTYSFEVLFDGVHKKSWPIEVIQVPQDKIQSNQTQNKLS
jgi:hypothetical protein